MAVVVSATFRLPPEVAEGLDALASREGRSKNSVVVMALRQFLVADARAGDLAGLVAQLEERVRGLEAHGGG